MFKDRLCQWFERPLVVSADSILTDGLHLEPVPHFEGPVQRHPHHTTETV